MNQLVGRLMGTALFLAMWTFAFGSIIAMAYADDSDHHFYTWAKKTEDQSYRDFFKRVSFAAFLTCPFLAWGLYKLWFTDDLLPPS